MRADGPRVSIEEALKAAHETRFLEIGTDLLPRTPRIFHEQFPRQKALIVADRGSWKAAGERVMTEFKVQGGARAEIFIYEEENLYAEHGFVEELENFLRAHEGTPIAVGSGTINDLTKLASHRVGRSYFCIPTAASMDGYTAFGASITYRGAKQTFQCPAPRGVLADLELIRRAPSMMNSWGYADLMAKVTAGADWILAEACGEERIHPAAWRIVQGGLREMLSEPEGIPQGEPEAIGRLTEGLMLAGFGMQAAQSSRPASGAEHQFSHLWDMEHHTHQGQAPSHGFKVGIATLAVSALYEQLLKFPVESLEIERCATAWKTARQWEEQISKDLESEELRGTGLKEMRAKMIDAEKLKKQIANLKASWSEIKLRIERQLLPFDEIRSMLARAGAPTEPEQIGISRERLRGSFWKAFFIRRRFTVLDIVARAGLMEQFLGAIFGRSGRWESRTVPTA